VTKPVIMEATGLVELADLAWLGSRCFESDNGIERWVGIGCSWKRLADPARSGPATPSLQDLAELLRLPLRGLRLCLHYSPGDPNSIAAEFEKLLREVPCLRKIHAIQLNSCLPLRVEEVKQFLQQPLLLMQLPIYRMTDTEVLSAIEGIEGVSAVDGVLVDGSGGRGSTNEQGRVFHWRRSAPNSMPTRQCLLGSRAAIT